MNTREKVLCIIAAILVIVGCFAGETNIPMRVVLVKMLCKCGGEMKPTGECLASYPPQYTHVCNKCSTTNSYNVAYPEIRYINEGN